jgi:hypothetical protein
VPRASEADLVARYGDVVARYNSTRNPDNVYEVRRKGVDLSCSCPGWRFRRKCRHIDRVAQGLDDDEAMLLRQERRGVLRSGLASAKLDIADVTGGYVVTYHRINAASNAQRDALLDRLFDALDGSGLFAAREEKPSYVARSRGLRVITLDD